MNLGAQQTIQQSGNINISWGKTPGGGGHSNRSDGLPLHYARAHTHTHTHDINTSTHMNTHADRQQQHSLHLYTCMYIAPATRQLLPDGGGRERWEGNLICLVMGPINSRHFCNCIFGKHAVTAVPNWKRSCFPTQATFGLAVWCPRWFDNIDLLNPLVPRVQKKSAN